MSDGQLQLSIPSDLPELMRFATLGENTPALRCCLILNQAEAEELVEYYNQRERDLKSDNFKSWNAADKACRTLCVQIDAFALKAFGKTFSKKEGA